MTDNIKEVYLSNLEWTKTHNNIGGVMGNIIFKDNMHYEDFKKLLKNGYFVLCDKDYITNLQEKLNLAENILYDYLYKDNKITKELYDKFKGGDKK